MPDDASVFGFRPIPPFRLEYTAWALRRRAHNAIDRWDGETYRRVLFVAGRPIELAARQAGPPDAPRLTVTATPGVAGPDRRRVRAMLERLLGLRIDLREWYRIAAGDRRLRLLADRFRGLKPPRFPSIFEALVNGFACQQLSLTVGLELLNRLAIAASGANGRAAAPVAFPPPGDLAALPLTSYYAIGFSRQKTRAIVDLARGIVAGDLDLEALARGHDGAVQARLMQLRGVGRWTAEYVLLRGLGRVSVFPGDDAGARKSLARWLGRPAALDYATVNRAVAKWQPYAGMIYFHLLLDGLSRAGVLEPGRSSVTVPSQSGVRVRAAARAIT